MKTHYLKPQDLLVALKMSISQKRAQKLNQLELAAELSLSQSEISLGIQRLQIARLINSDQKPISPSLKDALIFGVKYFFATEPGPITRGLKTANSHPEISKRFQGTEIFIWPDAEGDSRGQSLTPLYSTAPKAANKDDELYYALALLDTLRIGRRREVEFAKEELSKIIGEE